MELYRESMGEVRLYKPTADTVIEWAKTSIDDGETWVDVDNLPAQSQDIAFDLSVGYLETEGPMLVRWSFAIPGSSTSKQQTKSVNVVTPILHIEEIKEILGAGSTTEEAVKVERAVRHIINAHCGQEFGLWTGSEIVSGNGTRAIKLPRRLVAVKSGDKYVKPSAGWGLSADRWFITIPYRTKRGDQVRVNSFKEAEIYHSGTPYAFRSGGSGMVEGQWGWEQVPEPVAEAAKLLVNDYACGDSMYRDRFITSMTAADWRIQFNVQAYLDTGNVRANQLLAEYIIPGVGVI